MKLVATWLLLLGLGMGLIACGGSTEQTTVTQTVTEEAPPPEPAAPPASGGGSGEKVRVPNVVGKDHQLAQDTMQAAGLYNLLEEAATGQGRALLYDRNWTVVEQEPPPGTRVNSDQAITLRAKKDLRVARWAGREVAADRCARGAKV